MSAQLELTGKKFGVLTAIKKIRIDEKTRTVYWLCICECGGLIEKSGVCLIRNKYLKCLCNYKNKSRTTEYRSWLGMKQRCYYKKSKSYVYYGARGITVCERWLNSFDNFLKDMGYKPDKKLTLSRINNDGNYEPGNCKWADAFEQNRNRRSKVNKN